MLDELSFNVVEAIPYRTNKEKLNIMLEELKKNRYIETWDKYIYSAEKWEVKQ